MRDVSHTSRMNTPAHLLIGTAAFGRQGQPALFWAAALGAIMPDLSLYVLGAVSIWLLGIPPSRVFNELYFSDAWQTVFAIDNSFVLWGALLALALWARREWAVVLCAAALLHIALDFPLHHDDGRPHFWPISNWVFESPVSYWDVRHGASWIAPAEGAFSLCAAVLLWRAHVSWPIRALVLVLLLLEIWIVSEWLFFFVDS